MYVLWCAVEGDSDDDDLWGAVEGDSDHADPSAAGQEVETTLLDIMQHPAILGLLEHERDKLQCYLRWRAAPSADTIPALLDTLFPDGVPECCVRCWRTAHVFANDILENAMC
jgi:hypothetical protein